MSLDERLRRGLDHAAGLATIDPEADHAAALARARARHRRQRATLAAALVVVVLGASAAVWQLAGHDDDGATIADAGPTSTAAPAGSGGEGGSSATTAGPPDGIEAPPAVTVGSSERSLELTPVSYCYANGCVDGVPPVQPQDIGDAGELEVDFPLPDWSFTALFTQVVPEGQCPRTFDLPLERGDDGTFVLRPAGYAGTYDVTLAGQGQGGDLYVVFRWTTPVDGPLPEPEARLAVLSDSGGELESSGVELEVKNLAATPAEASASITVRAASGREVSFPAPESATLPGTVCYAGYLYWVGAPDDGQAAADLADSGPFTYEVDMVLDGVHHHAVATWPDDVIAGNEPSVALEFDPPLPALAER